MLALVSDINMICALKMMARVGTRGNVRSTCDPLLGRIDRQIEMQRPGATVPRRARAPSRPSRPACSARRRRCSALLSAALGFALGGSELIPRAASSCSRVAPSRLLSADQLKMAEFTLKRPRLMAHR